MAGKKWIWGLLLTALLLSRPQAAAQGAAGAMACWCASVAPAVFPFLALMPLLTCREAAQAYGRLLGRAMSRLFGLPGAAAPAMAISMVAGTPAGAIAARDVAARAGMERGQLHRLVVAAMGFSPAFLVGGVGAGMLGSAALGWHLALSQLLSQLTLALLLRRAWRDRRQPVPEAPAPDGANPVRGAVLSALTICGYMALFGALARVAEAWLGQRAGGALLCLLDVPSGARLLSELPVALPARLVMISGICGFGGACVIAQSLGALAGCGLGAAECLALRALAGVTSAGYTALVLRLGGLRLPWLPEAVRTNPLAFAALCASLMAVPVLLHMRKTIN